MVGGFAFVNQDLFNTFRQNYSSITVKGQIEWDVCVRHFRRVWKDVTPVHWQRNLKSGGLFYVPAGKCQSAPFLMMSSFSDGSVIFGPFPVGIACRLQAAECTLEIANAIRKMHGLPALSKESSRLYQGVVAKLNPSAAVMSFLTLVNGLPFYHPGDCHIMHVFDINLAFCLLQFRPT